MSRRSRALVLEGGGMRATYTAGVLEAFAEDADGGGRFDFVVACSAGACTAASYLAGQPQRNRTVYLEHLSGKRFIRWHRLLTCGDVMDIDYLTDEVHGRLCPLDLEALRRSPTPLEIGVTDAETGATRYLSNHTDDLLTSLRATCALPFYYRRPVFYQGRRYLDGGLSDPVPIKRAIALGATEVVVVLTSSIEGRGRKRQSSLFLSMSRGVRRTLAERHLRYREAAELLASPPPGVRILTVRPSRALGLGRATRDRVKLQAGCDLGRADGRAFLRGDAGG
ncbi:MAG TPA: patatin family protein [Vicinamibacteria bacterium]